MLESASDTGYPFLDLMLTIAIFFGWMIWFWLLILVFRDLLRRSDVSGWGKAGWTVLVIVLPYIGVLAYLIIQGGRFDGYARTVSRSDGHAADGIAKAKQLLDSGTINAAEFERLKKNALAS